MCLQAQQSYAPGAPTAPANPAPWVAQSLTDEKFNEYEDPFSFTARHGSGSGGIGAAETAAREAPSAPSSPDAAYHHLVGGELRQQHGQPQA